MKRQIRFIKSNYQPIFEIEEDKVIRITRADGYEVYVRCRYIDDYHFSVDHLTYHICEFAEHCERNQLSVCPEPQSGLRKAVWSAGKCFIVVVADEHAWTYSIYDAQQVFCTSGKIDNLQLPIEQVRDLGLQGFFKDVDPELFYESIQDYDRFMETTEESKQNRRNKLEIMLKNFRRQSGDAIMILQMYYGHPRKFLGTTSMKKYGYQPKLEDYEAIYIQPIDKTEGKNIESLLETIYMTFNLNKPIDFTGHSLSVSDIVLLKRNDVITSYMVDTFGFQNLDLSIP